MRRVLASDVKTMWVWKCVGISVGAAQRHKHRLALMDRTATHIDVARGNASGDVDRRFITQGFFHRASDQRWVGRELCKLDRMRQQKPDGIAYQVGCGEVAADKE